MSTHTEATQPKPAGHPWRAASASAIGSVLEYYDFFVYGPLAALVFPKLFFPAASPGIDVLLSLGTFAAGFLSRPIGGVLAGHFGDRIGRRSMLVTTFMVAGCATVGIGALPTYQQIGVAAPIILLALRFVQGLALGGEWGGASLLAVEHAPVRSRGFFGSLVQAGAPMGVITSSGTVAIVTGILTQDQLLSWGWRLPFLVSVVLVVAGIILRLKVSESPEFAATKAERRQSRAPVVDAVRRHPGKVLATIGIHASDTTLGFVQGIFILGFATHVLHFSATTVLLANIAGSAANLAWTPVAGHLADRHGARTTLAVGTAALAIWAFPMFWLINTGSTTALFGAMVIGSLIVATIFAPQSSFFASLFPSEIRYSGISIGFQIATVLGGGLGPLIAQALQNGAGGATWPVSTYLVVIAALAFLATLAIRPSTQHRPAAIKHATDAAGLSDA